MYEKLKRKAITPTLQDSFTSPSTLPAPPPPPPPVDHHPSISIRPYYTNCLVKSNKPQYSNGLNEDDLVSRLGRASNITGARSVFIPPQLPSPPPPQNHHSHYRHSYHRPTRIPSPSAAENSMFSFRHHPVRRDSTSHRSQVPPTATTAAETVDFLRHQHQHQHQQQPQIHDQQIQSYRHKNHRIETTKSRYYHKPIDNSRNNFN
jgi:hypothetical protein